MVQVYEDPGTGQQAGGGEEWSFTNAVAKGLAGTLGILAALAIDYLQKRDDSALIHASKIVNQAASDMNISAVPAYIYVAILLIAGFAMVYIFEPSNKRNAFYAGAGVLGFLATFSPIAQQTLQIPAASDLPSLDAILQATQTAPGGSTAPATPAPATTPSPADGSHAFNDIGMPRPILAAYRPTGEQRTEVIRASIRNVPVNIVVVFPAGTSGRAASMKVWLRNDADGNTEILDGRPRFARMGDKVVALYQTSVTTADSGGTRVELRVEAEGYLIYENTFSIGSVEPVARFDVALTPTDTPLVSQRLTHPYRW